MPGNHFHLVLFAPEFMLRLVSLREGKVQVRKQAESKLVRSRISSLLAAGTPLSTVHCLTLDVHMLLPCQHMLDVKSTLIEVLDLN